MVGVSYSLDSDFVHPSEPVGFVELANQRLIGLCVCSSVHTSSHIPLEGGKAALDFRAALAEGDEAASGRPKVEGQGRYASN